MNSIEYPILYSFRRCPYAMRVRFVLRKAKIKIELREILLKKKPKEFLKLSKDGTVPILLIPGKTVIQESLDIIFWAFDQKKNEKESVDQKSLDLIKKIDTCFKKNLDNYKYPNKFDIKNTKKYRDKNLSYLHILNEKLKEKKFLKSDELSFLDYSIFPFIRQFRNVDPNWFDSLKFDYLINWFSFIVESKEFNDIMKKYSVWEPKNNPIITNFIS